MKKVQSDIHATLLREVLTIKDQYLLLDDNVEKRNLLLNVLRETLAGENYQNSNFVNITDYYVSTGHISLDGFIAFLETIDNDPVDLQSLVREMDEDFDRLYDTQTSVILYQHELPEKITVQRFENSYKYIPTPIRAFNTLFKSLQELGVDFQNSIFMDIGSGMGRNLLLASHFPLKKIAGVEISRHLHEIASQNIKKYRHPRMKCKAFELNCLDALELEFPHDNMVLHFYEPFSKEVAAAVINKLVDFLKGKDLKVYLCFIPVVYPVVKSSKTFKLRETIVTDELRGTMKGYFTYHVYSN